MSAKVNSGPGGTGVTTDAGRAPLALDRTTMLAVERNRLAEERTLMGSYMGSCVPQRDIPRFIAMYRAGLLPVDLLRTSVISLGELNAAFDLLDRGEVARQVIRF